MSKRCASHFCVGQLASDSAAHWHGYSCAILAVAVLAVAMPCPCLAVTSESPEVKKLIKSGLERLNRDTDKRLGGRCIVAIAFIKAGQPNHGRVNEAVVACRKSMTRGDRTDIYSNGLAIIFLCEAGAGKYREEIQYYLDMLMKAQKPHGGWGYRSQQTGDTSQTQYAALSLWEVNRYGFHVDPDAVGKLADWLLKTQAPDGAWGYQGKVGGEDRSSEQSRVTVTMTSAGLGSTLICADMIGEMPSYGDDAYEEDIPDALKSNTEVETASRPTVAVSNFSSSRFSPAIQLGNEWMDANFTITPKKYNHYYLYALERYKSFQELYDGISQAEPQWYNEGFQRLETLLSERGGWESTGCSHASDTAFGVLFLLRSTQKTIRASLGEGTLTGGRGLPANVANATMRHGQIVVHQALTQADEMMHMIDLDQQAALDDLAKNPDSLVGGNVDNANRRRIQQMVRAEEPEVRLLAVNAIARVGDLDLVPTLIYALTDPDRRVVIAARKGLRFTSRRFEGFGLTDSFDDKQRYEAIDRWKSWYLALRPNAILEQ